MLLGLTTIGLMVAAAPGTSAAVGPDTACVVMESDLEERLSPLDSLTFLVGSNAVKVCYGRPSARGRTMIGGREVPFGRLWRTGANEPTMIHTTGAISVAGIELKPGSYSLYTIPDEDEWMLILNRSITQWGHIADYTYRVRRSELGRVQLPHERLPRHVETMVFRTVETREGPDLILEWERSRLRIPIRALGS